MSQVTVSLRLSSDLKAILETEAKSKGVTFSDLVRDTLMMSFGFGQDLNNTIDTFSKQFDVPRQVFIRNVIVRYLAEKQARQDIWGSQDELLYEFMKTSNGYLEDKALFDMLVKMFREEFGRQKEKGLLELEKQGKLSDKDREFLIRRRVGKAWIESPEFREEMNAKEENAKRAHTARSLNLIPSKISVDDDTIGRLYRYVEDGIFSQDDFVEQITAMNNRGAYKSDKE